MVTVWVTDAYQWEVYARIKPSPMNALCTNARDCRRWCFRYYIPHKHQREPYCDNMMCGCVIYRLVHDTQSPDARSP